MRTKSKWLLWVATLGGLCTVTGVLWWLEIWIPLRKSGAPDWLALEVRPPLGARGLIAAGIATLVTTLVMWLIRRMRGPNRGTQPSVHVGE